MPIPGYENDHICMPYSKFWYSFLTLISVDVHVNNDMNCHDIWADYRQVHVGEYILCKTTCTVQENQRMVIEEQLTVDRIAANKGPTVVQQAYSKIKCRPTAS